MAKPLTDAQQRNLAAGLSKNGFQRLGFGRVSRVLLYTCPKCGHVNHVVKNWRGPAPRGGFYCANNCGTVISL